MSLPAHNGHAQPQPRRSSLPGHHHQPDHAQYAQSRPATAPQPEPSEHQPDVSQARRVSQDVLADLKGHLEQSWQTAVASVANHLIASERHKDVYVAGLLAQIQRLQHDLNQSKHFNAVQTERIEQYTRKEAQHNDALNAARAAQARAEVRAEAAEARCAELERLYKARGKQLDDSRTALDTAIGLTDLVHGLSAARMQDMHIAAARIEDALMKPTFRAVFDCVRDEAFLLTMIGACGAAYASTPYTVLPQHSRVEPLPDDSAEVHALLTQKLPAFDEQYNNLQAGMAALLSPQPKKENPAQAQVPSSAPPGFQGLPRPANRIRLPSAKASPSSPTTATPEWLLFTQRKREAGQDVMQQKQALLQARAMFNPNQPSAKVVRPAPPGPHPAQPPAKRPRHASNVQTHPTQQGTAQAHPQQQRQQAVEVTIPAAPQHVPPNLPARTGSAARVPVKVLPLPELVQIATPPPSLPPTSTPSDPHVDAPEPASRPLTPTPPRPPPPTLPEPAEDDDPAFRELVQRITAEKLGEMWRQVDNSGLLQCRFCIYDPAPITTLPPESTNEEREKHLLTYHAFVWSTGIRSAALSHLTSGAEPGDMEEGEVEEGEPGEVG